MPDDPPVENKFHTFSVNAPDEFSFKAEHWNDWLARFERFGVVSELSSKSEEYQVNVLLYQMGAKSEELVKSINVSDSDLKSYSTVKDKITHFYEPKHNVIFCRAKFNTRYQAQGEPIESYISALHQLADKCKYGDLTHDLIRDRLAVGIRNKALSEKMQLTEDLTLEKAIDMAVQKELVSNQNKDLQFHNGQKPSVSALKKVRVRVINPSIRNKNLIIRTIRTMKLFKALVPSAIICNILLREFALQMAKLAEDVLEKTIFRSNRISVCVRAFLKAKRKNP